MTTEFDSAWDELLGDVSPLPPPPEFAGAADEEMRAGPSAKLPLAMVPMSGGDTDVQPIVPGPVFEPPPPPYPVVTPTPPKPATPAPDDALAAPQAPVDTDRARRVQVKTGPTAKARPGKRTGPRKSYPIVKPVTERHEVANAKRLGRTALRGATMRAPAVDEEIELDVEDLLLTGPNKTVPKDDDGIPDIDVSGPYEPVPAPIKIEIENDIEVEEVVTELDIDPSASASIPAPMQRDDSLMIAPPERFPLVWLGAAAAVVLVIGVALFAIGSGDEPEPEEEVPVTIVEAPPVEEVPPEQPPTQISASSLAPTDPPAADDQDPVPPPAARGAASASYAAAAKRYAEDRSNEALEIMAKAACDLDDGVQARSAFRKLAGRPARKRVYHHCTAREINLWYAGNTATPEEMLRQAERELAGGDAAAALETARKSNMTERSAAAVIVMGAAQCALERPAKAHALLRHLRPKDRPVLLARCKDAGFELEA